MRPFRIALLFLFQALFVVCLRPFMDDTEVSPQVIVGTPIRVEVEPEEELIEITDVEVTFPENEVVEVTYEDAQILMRIAAAEATAEGIEGKALVMAVVLNRVENEDFPDTVEGVVFQENQFSPISDGRYWTVEIDTDCHLALASIEMGLYNDFDALFFDNCKDSWASKNKEFIEKVGNHSFYK